MNTAERKAKLDALESFARALASLRQANVTVDVGALAELYDVEWPDAEEGEDREDTVEELAESHRRREAKKRAG